MFNNPFLEEAAASRNKRQQLDRLLRVTAPHERVILAGIGLVVLALVAWALFGSIARRVTIDGVLIEPGVRHEAVSTEPGNLVEFFVAPGDRVEPGEPIARQSVPELDREIEALHDRIEMLEAEIGPVGGDGGPLSSLLASARVSLVQMEARRSARESIVSQTGGEVMALRSAPGEYLPVGAAVAQIRDADEGPLQAVLGVAPRVAERIQPGMQASVEFAMPDGSTSRLNGEVASVTAGGLPNWLAALGPEAADFAHRVDIVLQQADDLSLPDGTRCRVRIELGRQSPAALFEFGRP